MEPPVRRDKAKDRGPGALPGGRRRDPRVVSGQDSVAGGDRRDDVVEGTALASLPYMGQVIGRRPDRFSSVQDFVKYAYTSGLTKNFEAARVSGASQVVQDEDGQGWRWRTDLRKTEKWWREWYEGLSAKFLSVPAPKLLLLAGTDRLDKELTIGHMAGKFKVPARGHAIQEDEPEKTADAVDEFIQRYLYLFSRVCVSAAKGWSRLDQDSSTNKTFFLSLCNTLA